MYEAGIDTTYSVRVAIRQCELGVECGRVRFVVLHWSPSSGISRRCAATLRYEGTEGDAFVFGERIQSGTCANALMYLTPLPSGHAFGVEEYWESSFGTVGYLLPEYYFPGHM